MSEDLGLTTTALERLAVSRMLREALEENTKVRAENGRLRLAISKARIDLSEFGEAWTGAMIGCVQRDLEVALTTK